MDQDVVKMAEVRGGDKDVESSLLATTMEQNMKKQVCRKSGKSISA